MNEFKLKKKIDKRCFVLICIISFFLLFGKFIYEKTIMPVSQDVAINTMIGKGESRLSVSSLDIIEQKFIAQEDIQGIILFFGKEKELLNEGNIGIEIIDEEDKTTLFDKKIDVTKIELEQKYPISFDKRISLEKGKEYCIKITSDVNKRELFLYGKNVKRNDCHLLINKERKNRNLSFGFILARDNSFLKYFFASIMIFILLLVLTIFWLIYFRHTEKIEIIYFISVLVIGSLYVFIMKPNAVPDEGNHYSSAYARSNEIMRFKESELLALDEADVINVVSNIEAYRALYDSVKGDAVETSVNQNRPLLVEAPLCLHFFSAMGITFGRLIGFNNIVIFYMGRLFNLLFFALTTYYAVKKMPFCKMGIVAICMFPMTMHLAASYSYDAIINGTSFLFIAYVLNIIYSDNLISLKDSILLFITGLIIVSCKSVAYVPICLMIIFIPKRKFLKIKRQIIFNLSLLIGWAGWYVWQSLSVTKSVVGGSYYIEWAHEKAYTISMIINNPLHSIYVMENTLWEYVDVWFMNLIGKNLGWFDVPLLNIIIFLFLLIFLLSIIKVEQSDINSNALFRGGLAVLCCLSVGLVIGGMWLGWTPQSDELIGGVQGRYFLPVLPMTICIFQNSLLSLKRCIDKEIMIILASLECVTLCNILLVVLK